VNNAQGSSGSDCDVARQLNSYITAVSVGTTLPADTWHFWSQQKDKYHNLVPLAQASLLAFASQPYGEMIFSLCSLQENEQVA